MKRVLVLAGLWLASPVGAQSPTARLAFPAEPVVPRAASPDPFQDGPRLPAARLGNATPARIGEGPPDASPEERYNWGAPRDRRPPSSSTARERDAQRTDLDDRPDHASRSAPRGQPTHGKRRPEPGEPPPLPEPGSGPVWWPDRERDLADLREQFPAFGDQGDRDRLAFQSDCAFDDFSSPITNPFLAEDPRSLTELRPIFLYQTIPTAHDFFRGGNAYFFGTQFRVAFTDRFSVVLHKFGGQRFSPDNPGLTSDTGLAEIWLGPKFTFWRNPDNQALATFGLQFQMAVGSGSVFQNTGTLGLVPYLSFGRELGRTDYGTFRLINVAGYHLGTGSERSDYFYDTLHLSLDAGDNHRFYPTLELTWFHYTSSGADRPFLNFEGRDLANIGARAAGQDYLSLAPGFRYRFTDFLQFGVAAEFGLTAGSDDPLRFRLGLDLIWRY